MSIEDNTPVLVVIVSSPAGKEKAMALNMEDHDAQRDRQRVLFLRIHALATSIEDRNDVHSITVRVYIRESKRLVLSPCVISSTISGIDVSLRQQNEFLTKIGGIDEAAPKSVPTSLRARLLYQ